MEIEKIVNTISFERFAAYQKRYPKELDKAFSLYQSNIEISQSFYSNLSILEVSLRNSINKSFISYYSTKNWLMEVLPKNIELQIKEIITKLEKSKKDVTNDRIIAELNFGFWTMLFNRGNARYYWKPLLRAFPYLPKNMRKRTIVSAKLNRLRTFRNRIYHYDPIIWNIKELVNRRSDINEILYWIEPNTAKWARSIDTFGDVKNKLRKRI